MKPEKPEYKIANMGHGTGEWCVLSPYDLFTMPNLCKVGLSKKSKSEALLELERIYELDMQTYERLKKMGRSFPDND